ADDHRVECGQAPQGFVMLLQVEVERRPAGTELGPGGDRVARNQEPALRPVEREVSRRVARSVHDPQRPEGVTFVKELVDRTRVVLRPAEEETELEREQAQ